MQDQIVTPSPSPTPSPPSSQAGWGERSTAATFPAWWAPALSSLFIVVWALWAVAFNQGQFGDNIEQYNWQHSLEWGYHKHPPLPTWLLGAVIRLFGMSSYWAIALAAACLLGALWFTWDIARRLCGERVATVALLLWTLHLFFSSRVQLYNHNTVMVLFMAATVWCSLRAAEGRLVWWIATGACAGLALLCKYQAALPLGGLLFALAWSGHLGTRRQWLGLGLAIAALGLVCMPHALWVTHHHFSTLHYAAEAIEPSNLWQRLGFVLSFVVNQLRMFFPLLLAVAIYSIVSKLKSDRAAKDDAETMQPVPEARKWFFGLIGLPALALLVMALGGGVTLRNHWGVQSFQFLSVWLAYRWSLSERVDTRRLAVIAVIVQALSLGLYVIQAHDPDAQLSKRRMDTEYPARRLADEAVAKWEAATDCPLRYVAGSAFAAGLVSVYSGQAPAVYEGANSPWISETDLARHGVLYVVDARTDLPADITPVGQVSLAPGARARPAARTITLGIQLPAEPCSEE